MTSILVYADEGACRHNLEAWEVSFSESIHAKNYQLRHVFAKDLTKEGWDEDCALLVFVGGRDVPYHQKLKGQGNQNILNYIEKGGRYLGLCAGAYYGASEVIFEKGTPLEVHEKRELAFFPGSAVGAVYQDRPFSYHGSQSAHAALIDGFEGSFYAYYNGGCAFDNAEQFKENVEVVSNYHNSILENAAAIVCCSIGKGEAWLCGVHFEISFKRCPKHTGDYALLEQAEPQRKSFFDQILLRILS